MLILFDIDGTILRSQGAGITAMVEAGRSLFGSSLSADGIPVAGRLDPLIMADMLARARLEVTPARLADFRAAYTRSLAAAITAPSTSIVVMPGIAELVRRLAAMPDRACLGLLTGNFAETAAIKLAAAGFDPSTFKCSAWGDDSPSSPPTRNDLPAAAMARHRAACGQAASGRDVVIIGDTPHDVACARAHGCRSLAVATGNFKTAELAAAGADRAVDHLGDVDATLAWLFGAA